MITARLLSLVLLVLAIAPAAARADARDGVRGALRLLEQWDVEGAEEALRELQAKAPNDRGTVFVAARIAFENGEYSRAVELFEEALGAQAKDSDDWQLASGAERETRGMVSEESAHFIISYKPGKDAALVPYALEALEAAHAALTKDLGYEPPRKVRVEIYGSPKALARVSSLSEEAIKTTGTIALCKYNRLMITSPRALVRGYEWQDTLAHEYVHFLVTRSSRNTVPIWLHEGLAKYLETRWRGSAGLALDDGSEALLARALKEDRLIPFEKMHPSIALLPTQEDAALAFAQVFTAVQLIDQKKGTQGLRELLDALRSGRSDKDAVAAAMGMSFPRFETAWKKSLHGRKAEGAPAFEKLVFKDDRRGKSEGDEEGTKAWDRGDLRSIPDTQARRFAHLGELLRARGRQPAAAIEYEKAIARVGASHPTLARKYALTLHDLKRYEDEEKVLRQTLDAHPNDATNNLLLGRLLVETDRAAKAKAHLLVANRRDPFDARIHALLLAAARATGDRGLEARELDVLRILDGKKTTWRAAAPGNDPQAVGFLRIESPGGARLFIDGVDTGLTTPVAEHPLPAGSRVVRLELPDGSRIEETIDVGADQLVPFPQS